MQGFVEIGQKHFLPLIQFRDWLKGIRNNPELRQATRRNGKLTFNSDGKHIPGPFTIQARQEILRRLQTVQEDFGDVLITDDEIKRIHEIWTNELLEAGGIEHA